jgi:hypothetical protein
MCGYKYSIHVGSKKDKLMKRNFGDYIKFRESDSFSGVKRHFPGEGEYEPIKLAWKRYRTRVIDFLHELDDPEIEEAIKSIDDEGLNKSYSDKDSDNDDAVIVPKADGSPGMEDGGWD